MGLFMEVDEIWELVDRLDGLMDKRFREVARMDAEEIADTLIEKMGLDNVCRDIDEAISEADDMIWESADTNVTYNFDNYLLSTFTPYEEARDVDEYIVKEAACAEDPSDFVDKTVRVYAFELWRNGIRNELKKILKEKCSRYIGNRL